jgi:hypothetical protein
MYQDELANAERDLARSGIGIPDAVYEMMAEKDRVYRIRTAQGWELDEGGWYHPNGMSESEWEDDGYPLPEEVVAYSEFTDALKNLDGTVEMDL